MHGDEEGSHEIVAAALDPLNRQSRHALVLLDTTNELLAFLYIARGSAGEVRSMLVPLARRPWLAANLQSEVSNLKSMAESCSRQLRAWADSLQNSDIAGLRHLNNQSHANYQKRKAREAGAVAFQQLLAQHLPPDHPLRAGKSQI